MEKVKYWLKNVIKKQDKRCKKCCVFCKWYNICKNE